jgi:hypothetical protein
MSRRKARIVISLASVAALGGLSTACRTHDGSSAGTALETGHVTVSTIAPIGPGKNVGILLAPVVNVSSKPLTITGVDVAGPGIGDVVQVVETKLAPDGQGLAGFPGGIWTTDPPVDREHDGCHSPRLEPVDGFVLPPGGRSRVWIVIRGIKEGAFAETSQTVSYEQDGQGYRQEVAFYFKGSVKDGSDGPKMDPSEVPCLSETTPLNE